LVAVRSVHDKMPQGKVRHLSEDFVTAAAAFIRRLARVYASLRNSLPSQVMDWRRLGVSGALGAANRRKAAITCA
jgi:hypothetical protein